MRNEEQIETKTRARQADSRHMNVRVLGWSVIGAIALLGLLILVGVYGVPV